MFKKCIFICLKKNWVKLLLLRAREEEKFKIQDDFLTDFDIFFIILATIVIKNYISTPLPHQNC